MGMLLLEQKLHFVFIIVLMIEINYNWAVWPWFIFVRGVNIYSAAGDTWKLYKKNFIWNEKVNSLKVYKDAYLFLEAVAFFLNLSR